MELMYLRKSRADGEESAEAVLQRHERILQDFAGKTYGHAIPEDAVFREVVSGETIRARPAMMLVLELLQSREVSAVLVVDPQRLSRGDLRDCGTVIRAFQYTGTLIATPQKTYDLRDKFDRKFLEMELMRGNDYLEYVKEIMLRGRIASVREGKYIGSVPPFGYDKIRTGKTFTLAENAESDAVRLIFALCAQGEGLTEICRRLDALGIRPRKKDHWAVSSLREILRNPVYTGKLRWNCRKTVRQYRSGEIVKSRPKAPESTWLLPDGRHPPLVSEALFAQVQERMGSSPRVQQERKMVNPFAGLCRCVCGAAVIRKPCREPRLLCREQARCHNASVLCRVFEAEVLSCLRRSLPAVEVSYRQTEIPYAHLESRLLDAARAELAALDQQEEKLCTLLERGIYTEEVFLRRRSALAERRAAAEAALRNAENAPPPPPAIPPRCLTMPEILGMLGQDTLTPEQKNRFLRTVVAGITYAREGNAPISLRITLRL